MLHVPVQSSAIRLFLGCVIPLFSIYLIDAVSDDGGPVDHGDLVHQLHFVPQRRVKHDGAQPDHEEGRVRRDEPLLEALLYKSELVWFRKYQLCDLCYV